MLPVTVTWLPLVVPPPRPPLPSSGEGLAEGPVVRSADTAPPKALAADGAVPEDAPSEASGVGPGAGTGVGAGPVVGPEPTWVCRSIGEVLGGLLSSAAAAAAAWPITPATTIVAATAPTTIAVRLLSCGATPSGVGRSDGLTGAGAT